MVVSKSSIPLRNGTINFTLLDSGVVELEILTDMIGLDVVIDKLEHLTSAVAKLRYNIK